MRYAVRFLVTLLTMELVLHFMYVVAIKDAHAWGGDSVAELSMIGFWNLMVVWLKVCPIRRPFFLFYQLNVDRSVVAAVAVLPAVGSPRRRRPARKHGPVHGEQLLHPRLLAELASLV